MRADVQDDAPNENTDGGDWSEPCSPINVVIADEEFARRLHLEEQSHHRRRLMEMAGVSTNVVSLMFSVRIVNNVCLTPPCVYW